MRQPRKNWRGPKDRDDLERVHVATRVAIARALECDLRRSELRTLLGIVHELSTWTRGWNTLRRDELLKLVRQDPRTFGKAVAALDAAECVVYVPGRGHDSGSWIAFPDFEGDLPRAPDRPILVPIGGQREAATVAASEEARLTALEAATVAASSRKREQEEPSSTADAAADELESDLRRLGVAPSLVPEALTDVDRARAWLEVVRREARVNPAGFFAKGFLSGGWPSPRDKEEARVTRASESLRVSLRNLVQHSYDESARELVDDRALSDEHRTELLRFLEEEIRRRGEIAA